MRTVSIKPADIKKKWVVVDATDRTLGRLASEIARVLRGKHKADFTPHIDCGDYVIVTNAGKVALTGQKRTKKDYNHHTGYIGGIKTIMADKLLEKRPTKALEIAVRGMLPKSKLGKKMFGNLKLYAGSEHPHAAQKPEAMGQRTVGKE